jgi:uncharacterized protein (TIGR00255 family)
MSTTPSPLPVRSMTGFAAERSPTSLGELMVSLRAVNHRGLDLHFHGGHEFAVFENEMRALLKKNIARGHVDIRIELTRSGDTEQVSVDYEALGRYLAVFRQASEKFGLQTQPDLNLLFALPGLLKEAPSSDTLPAGFLPELLGLLEGCAISLNEHREREGHALRNEMTRLAGEIESWTGEISALREQAQPYFLARLREKLVELLGSAALNESRLIEEAALLADRSDIQEEVVRLGVHTGELQRLLAEGNEIGKRIDFLLQEMNREINTTLAKSANVGDLGLRITNLGLAIKANIERIREQGLNLE